MKKIVILFILSLFIVSCVSKRETINTGGTGVTYDAGEEAKVQTNGTRLWILFIPIGIGNIKYSVRKEKAIQRFLKQNNCDAILNGMIVDRKVIVPLILINYSYRWTVLKGKPLKVKN